MINQSIKKFYAKFYKSAFEATKDIPSSSKIMVGGFGICGIPQNLILALAQHKINNLTIVSNTGGIENWGVGILIKNNQVKRMMSSYIGQNKIFQKKFLKGQIQVELVPQGSLAQRIRAAGAGIPAFYTPTGVNTYVQQGKVPIKFKKHSSQPQILSKPRQIFNGKQYILEQAIYGDYSLIKAQKADTKGNLYFNKSANNFNGDMATASKCCIAEVQQIVPEGSIDPNKIHVPGIFVDRVYKGQSFKKKFQKITTQQSRTKQNQTSNYKVRQKIAKRCAKQIKDGMYINLGIGIPCLIPNFIQHDKQIEIHGQNGVIGIGPYPNQGDIDADLINAAKQTISVKKGSSFFNSSTSFAIIRGNHLDITILGSMQVSKKGDIANWIIPGKLIKGMGGAMDLIASAKNVIVAMQHVSKQGNLKLLQQCELPLTSKEVVNMLVTQKGVFVRQNGILILKELAQDCTLQEIQKATGFKIEVDSNLKRF